jgi:hypothetical protein
MAHLGLPFPDFGLPLEQRGPLGRQKLLVGKLLAEFVAGLAQFSAKRA